METKLIKNKTHFLIYVHLCVYIKVYMHYMLTDACKGQLRASDPQELELQTGVTCVT